MSRIEVKDGGKANPKVKGKGKKGFGNTLELSVLCRQVKDSGSEEEEEKAKVEEKDEEKEKARKEVKERKAKAKAKVKARKEKENALAGLFVESAIKKDIGEMNAPTDIQYGT